LSIAIWPAIIEENRVFEKKSCVPILLIREKELRPHFVDLQVKNACRRSTRRLKPPRRVRQRRRRSRRLTRFDRRDSDIESALCYASSPDWVTQGYFAHLISHPGA
jgi:hypothetical protein